MNSEDKIREQFQSKFSDFKITAPSDGWSRLEESLDKAVVARKAVIRRRWQYASSAAAILVILLGGLFYLNQPSINEEPILSEAVIIHSENEEKKEVKPEQQTVQPSEPQGVASSLFAERTITATVVKSKGPAVVPADYTEQGSLQTDDLKETDITLKASDDGLLIEETNETGGYTFDEEFFIIDGDDLHLYAEYEANDNEGDYILSFGGKGGLSSFHQTVNSPMTLRSAAFSNDATLPEEDKMLFQANNIRDNIAEMEHDQPVSFGITVSKSISDNLYIETGLVYSYLHSKSKNTSTAIQNHQSQSLHYLGVPLNLNYNLFSVRDLDVYVSLGGMIEKDVYGKFREEGEGQSLDDQNKSEVLIDENISQKNPQLSVNTGVGLSYPIYRDLKLYGKIGGAYYFDAKNDYKTIYSDRKIVMDLSLGIRYEF